MPLSVRGRESVEVRLFPPRDATRQDVRGDDPPHRLARDWTRD